MDRQDNRRTPRRRMLKDGKIVIKNDWSVIDCSVRDISETGARIRCENPATIPDEFRLLILSDNTIRDASVIWRRGEQVGLTFTSPPKPAPPRKW